MVHKGFWPAEGEAAERLWHFAGCEFDEMRLELRVRAELVDLELKPMEILLQLLRHAGEVCSKQELLDAVWPGLVVVDGSLATAVSKLRRALGDELSSMVLTIPRVGYRIAVPVRSEAIPAASARTELNLKAGDTIRGREHWRLNRPLDASANSEVWLAEHTKTHELRVFKFASSAVRLKSLKREVTVWRFLKESLGDDENFVRVLEWNFEVPPYFLESEYSGADLVAWAERAGGLSNIPLEVRLGLVAQVARAVAAAHGAGVLHKDLKPANILVSSSGNGGWQAHVADFGSASMVESSRLKALGITNLALTQTGETQTPALTGTIMYLAPETLLGQRPTAATDVYALGVMLYQLVAGNFRKPLAPGWEADVPDALIRQDIAEAACGNPANRLASAAELSERILTLDRRRREMAQLQERQEREHSSERRRERVRARRPWVLLASGALLLSLVVSLILLRRELFPKTGGGAVAVLPFQNAGTDRSLDFLGLALPDEIATQLSYARTLPIRPLAITSRYVGTHVDLPKAGKEMGVRNIVTGRFLRIGEQLMISIEAVDVERNRLLWRDTVTVPAANMLAMQEQIAAVSRGGLAPALGSSSFAGNGPPQPRSEDAYDLYMHSIPVSTDAASNREAIAMLQRAVALDANYAPAWSALSLRYYYDGSYAGGGERTLERADAAAERALTLDPGDVDAGSNLVARQVERGQLAKAYQAAGELMRRRPDNGSAHFLLSYVLRYAGLLQQAATECETARSLDPDDRRLRSCSGVFLLRGDYQRSLDFVRLDQGSEWSKPHVIDALLRQGKVKEALLMGPTSLPGWQSYNMLLACANHRPAAEITTIAKSVAAVADPEVNYYFASHLAYCGQTSAALALLEQAVRAGYCSYPALDADPFFASVRGEPAFAKIRAAAIDCQRDFLARR